MTQENGMKSLTTPVLLLEHDAFGVVGRSAMEGIRATLKRDRRKAVVGLERMLRAFKLLLPNERVLTFSIGSDRLGNETLVVVKEGGGE
jgi:hypothetical protein